MDISVTASKLIDRAILLEEGGAIVIPCSSYEEMEKLRIRLYKIRRQLEKQHRDLSSSLDITRKVRKNKWTLYITKDTSLSGVFIIESGEAKPFTSEQVLEEEGSEELLESSELPESPEDFDDVAAKIEQAQDSLESQETSKSNIS